MTSVGTVGISMENPMSVVPILGRKFESRPKAPGAPIVFVVDADISVRESLEVMIDCEGWRAKTFASAQEFLACPRALVPSCLCLTFLFPAGRDGRRHFDQTLNAGNFSCSF